MPADVAFALETARLTLGAAGACLVAAALTACVAVVYANSTARPEGRGRFLIVALWACACGLAAIGLEFWSLP
jgi:hypothetical protein